MPRSSSTASNATPTGRKAGERHERQPRCRGAPQSERATSIAAGGSSSPGVAALAGVTLAPGITLFELAHGRAPAEPASNEGALGHADRHQPVRVRLQRLRHRLRHGERPVRRARRATDSQWIRKVELKDMRGRPRAVAADDVPALRRPALRRRLPDRRVVQARRRHRAGRPPHLHRLPLLHDGLPVQGALVRARAGHRPEPDVPRGKGCVESCTLCVHRIDRDQIPACVEACAATGHKAILFGDLNDPESEIAQRDRAVAHHGRCAPTCGSTPACATRGSEGHDACAEPHAPRAAPASGRSPPLGALVALAGLARRALHGGARPHRHRHEQPDRLGHAARVRDLPDRRRLGRAQRRLDRLGVRQGGLQGARAAVGPAVPRAARGRPRRADARPRPPGAHDRRRDALQLHVGVRVERVPLLGLVRDRRRLPVDADGAADERLRRAGRASRRSSGASC